MHKRGEMANPHPLFRVEDPLGLMRQHVALLVYGTASDSVAIAIIDMNRPTRQRMLFRGWPYGELCLRAVAY